ncbi:MAG: hypothetical protein JWN50_116 [Parcubacteria group bacterium]|nr:hypothetical protein [Parcubacteria group bacterium]
MSIPETIHFDKDGEPVPGGHFRELFRKVFLALVILLVAGLGFGVGRLSAGEGRKGVEIRYDNGAIQALSSSTSTPASVVQGKALDSSSGSVYASSKGTKYYYTNCKSSVTAANKVTFAAASMAEAAGYTLATNCKKP